MLKLKFDAHNSIQCVFLFSLKKANKAKGDCMHYHVIVLLLLQIGKYIPFLRYQNFKNYMFDKAVPFNFSFWIDKKVTINF